jgi:hypothetical protein
MELVTMGRRTEIAKYEDEYYTVTAYVYGPRYASVETVTKRNSRTARRAFRSGINRAEDSAKMYASKRLKELADIREEMRLCGDRPGSE